LGSPTRHFANPTEDDMIEAVLSVLTEKAVGRVFEFISAKAKFDFIVRDFWASTQHDCTAVLILIELTNRSADPWQPIDFSLTLGKKEYVSRVIDKVDNDGAGSPGELVSVHTGSGAFHTFEGIVNEYWDPMERPYLQRNESAIGLVVFELPLEVHSLDLSVIKLGVRLGGTRERIEAKVE
jgi:hypothetical protein